MLPFALTPTPALRQREEFERNPKAYLEFPSKSNAVGILETFIGAKCAGMRDRGSGEDILQALRNKPDIDASASATIRWLLGPSA